MLSFRAQLVLVFTVLLLLFAIAAGWLAIATVDGALRDDGLRAARQAAESQRDQLAARLALRRQRAATLLESVASSCDQSGRINTACAGEALSDWAARNRARYAVLEFPRTRRITFGRPQPAQPALYRDDRGLVFALSVRDLYSGGSLTAVLDASELDTSLASGFARMGTGSLLLLDSAGAPLSRLPAVSAPVAALASRCSSPEHAAVLGSGDSRVLAFALPLAPEDACVVAQLPLAELLQPSALLRWRFAGVAALFLVVAAAVAFPLAHVIARPLRILTRRVEGMGRGDYDSPVPRSGPAEVRQFADAFAVMARSLRESYAALRASEEKLRLSYRAARLWPWECSPTRGLFRWMDFSGPEPVAHEEQLDLLLARVHPDDRDALARGLAPDAPGGAVHFEFRYTKLDGETIWISSRGERIQRITGPVVIGVNLDVTHRRRMEELERDRERLAASASIAAELAHEINNPLAAATGALYLLKDLRPGTDEHARCLDIASDATQRITRIARQLLGLYHRSAGAERVDLAQLVAEVADAYGLEAASRSVTLRVDLRGEAPLVAQPAELRTAVANVVKNAITSVGTAGAVAVRVRNTRERGGLGRPGVRVTVADSGAGIAPAHLGRVFEAFFSTREERGTGLGLWVTSNIVRKHYGHIRVRSAQAGPRHGTTVSIFLPRLDPDDALRASPHRAA